MQTRKLGWTDLNLSAVGLGTWAIGGGDYAYGLGTQDDHESMQTIWHALDQGINWIDTAPMYGTGHSETIVGKAINGRRDSVFLSTKCGLVWDKNKMFDFCLTKDSIRKEIEDTLRRLDTDYIDLYKIHVPRPESEIEEAWYTIHELIDEGKVRYAGVSNFRIDQLRQLQVIHPVACIQHQYNMLNRDLEDKMLEYCMSNEIGIITYSPLCSGLITGNANIERIRKMNGNDFRCQLPDFKEPLLKPNLEFIENLKPIAQKNSLTIAQLALTWVLRMSEITSAIVGSRRPSQIHEFCLKTFAIPEEDAVAIDSLTQELIRQREQESHIGIPGRILNVIKLFLSNLAHPVSDEDRSPWSK